MTGGRRFWWRWRSAITGLFVTREKAEADPEATVREKVERKGSA